MSKERKTKANIKVKPDLCSECLRCSLVCSFTYTGACNPQKARVIPQLGKCITFTDDCITNCILCTRYCPTGALTPLRR